MDEVEARDTRSSAHSDDSQSTPTAPTTRPSPAAIERGDAGCPFSTLLRKAGVAVEIGRT